MYTDTALKSLLGLNIMAIPSRMNSMFVPFYLLLFGYIFVVSGLIVCVLMFLTYICVWPLNKSLYRKMITSIGYIHWCQITFIAQWWSGTDVTITVENPDDFEKIGTEHTLVIMNHKYDIDWIMTWIVAERRHILGGGKFVGKAALKKVPILGWAWMLSENIFLSREWDKDKSIISRDLQFIADYPKNVWVSLLMFCEGTRFTEEKHKVSLEFARKKGIPELKHLLLPRTKGFVQCMHGLKGKIPAIQDFTIAFDRDYAEPTFLNILSGNKCKAEMFLHRIPLEKVPTDNDEECAEWLHQLYRDKDAIFEHFEQNGTFKMGHTYHIPRKYHDLVIWLLWAIVLSIPLVHYGMKIIMSGSLTVQVTTLICGFLLYRGLKAMSDIMDTNKGSSYGRGNSSNIGFNNNKTK